MARETPIRSNRKRVFEFALWMQSQEPKVPSAMEVNGWLQSGLNTARRWRTDWLLTRGRRA